MAQHDARALYIQREDPDNSGTWLTVCGIRTRTLTMSNAQVDTTVPPCPDPTGPIIATAAPGRQTITFTGDGLFDDAYAGTLVADDARLQREAEYRIIVPGYGEFIGPFFVSDFEWTGDMEEKLAFSATWVPLNGDLLTFVPEASGS